MIDYERIIQGLDTDKVISLMQSLGADRYEKKSGYVIFPTICHNIDAAEASMKLYFYENSKIFNCYTCCGTMSIFKFLKEYYKTRDIEYNWFDDIYNVVLNCSVNREFEPKKELELKSKRYMRDKDLKLPIYDKNVLNCFTKYYPVEWLNDGISKSTMDKFNILFSISQNKIIIPHYNLNGDLVGIRGRALNEWEVENMGKYMPVQIEDKWYTHKLSFNLYGLNFTKEAIKENGYCCIYESEKSVMQADSFSRPNCGVAVGGSNLNQYALRILLRECHPKEVILCFDKEELPHEEKYFNKLYNICKKYNKYCNFSFIYDRENLLRLKDSPTDRGEEIFNKLIEKRVHVL